VTKFVKDWQEKLSDLSLYAGKIDGDFGPMTLTASMELIDAEELGGTKMSGIEQQEVAPDFSYSPPKRSVNELIWHCAATPEGRDFTVDQIDQWHRARGWSGIGYHFVVYRDGTIKRGRDNERTGAHVAGRNTGTIGSTYIGGVSSDGKTAKDTRTAEQRAAMIWLTKQIAADKRIKKISGHNEYAAKACPSFDVCSDELGNIPNFVWGNRK